MDDIKFEIIKKLLPHELKNLSINKDWYRFLLENSEYISKLMLTRCNVDYKDSGNFIYKMNNVDINDYKKDDTWKYKSLLKLYMKFYDMEIIDCVDKEITSFPIYPNMVEFYGSDNQLTSFPVQPKMKEFYGNNNQLTSFPVQPEMKIFKGRNNQLTSFPKQPKMETFSGDFELPYDI